MAERFPSVPLFATLLVELFGFDRAAAISTQTAEEIAQAAQAFGQEHDITVLTLTFAPSANLAEVAHA